MHFKIELGGVPVEVRESGEVLAGGEPAGRVHVTGELAAFRFDGDPAGRVHCARHHHADYAAAEAIKQGFKARDRAAERRAAVEAGRRRAHAELVAAARVRKG